MKMKGNILNTLASSGTVELNSAFSIWPAMASILENDELVFIT